MEKTFFNKIRKVSFRYGEAIHILFPDKILFCHEQDHSTIIYMAGEKFFSLNVPLAEIEKVLTDKEFWRTNDHYLINLRYLKNIPSGADQTLMIDGNHSIPIDLQRKEMLIEAITKI